MAFGFGFNKQKVLSAAEKYVQQGKLQNAITEYEKILKNDAKDLTVANTVGDLYSRLGEADKATECFKSVGDAYASQGFTVKAIAMYKKISKLKPSLESVLKLAELYTQQGLFNDARAQYLQVAEEFLKAGELENAVRIFQKILEMDPENVNMRVRLAEVYIRLGKKNDAWQIFSAAAESLRSKGSLGAAEEVLQRMLTLDPGNSYALLMQGRNLVESGDAEGAIASLQKIGDLDSNPEGMRDLLKAYLQVGRLSDAGTIANKLLTVHNDLPAISSFADALIQAGQFENALQVYDQHSDRLLAQNSEKILENLHQVIGHVRENPASLEKLLALFQKAGETTHITEVLELLAHASVQSGDLTRARDLYQKLAALEPQNPLHMQSYQQMASQIGGMTGARLITSEEAAVIVDELEATAPPIHQHYPDELALTVRSALTDAELFISYNMPAKALGPLLATLPQAPQDLRLNQRLAALHTRAGRFAEAAVCCRTLQSLYSEAEYPEEATRYGELADRYEERSSALAAAVTPEEIPIIITAPAVASVPESEVEEAPAAQSAAAPSAEAAPWPAGTAEVTDAVPEAHITQEEFAVVGAPESSSEPADALTAEIDLSSEWEDEVTVEAPGSEAVVAEIAPDTEVTAAASDHEAPAAASEAPAANVSDETIEEIRFYLAHGMPEQASAALAKLRTQTRESGKLAQLRAEVEAAVAAAKIAEEAAAAESIEELAVEDIPSAEVSAEELPVQADSPSVAHHVSPPHRVSPELHVSPEFHVSAEPEAIPVEAEAAAEPAGEPAHAATAPGGLKEFVADLESSLGDTFMPGPEPVEPARATGHKGTKATKAAETKPADVELAPVAHTEPAVSRGHEPAVLGEFVADIEASLGEDFLKAAPLPAHEAPVSAPSIPAPLAASAAAATAATHVAPGVVRTPPAAIPPRAEIPKPHAAPAPAAPAAAKASPFAEEAGVDLAEMFGELKHDLEAGVASTDEDPETHYNLGIAFREMGLLDEAIGELQKACQSVDRGHAFPQIMQTYTWLAQCFLDKGVPEAAVRWYDKALSVPTIDGETRVALHYELASAFETAGDKPSALKHFMHVYGSNIDYRDVAERIKALKS
jgi:tetratricopeptide (TPR) repeat protein